MDFQDVVGGSVLGFAWVILFGWLKKRHPEPPTVETAEDLKERARKLDAQVQATA